MNISNCLLLHCNINNPQSFEWLPIINKFHDSETQTNDLLEIAHQHQSNDIVIISPGTDTTTTSISLPTTRHSQLQTAIPFALEEQLASDLQQLHFVFHPEGKTKFFSVAITAKKQLHDWLEEFNKAKLKPIKIIPEYLALPIKEDEWTVVITDNYGLVRTNLNTGYAIEQNHLFTLLSQQYAQVSETKKPQEIYVINLSQKDIILPLDLSFPKEIIRLEKRNCSICHIFRQGLVNSPTDINLLPHEFHFGSGLKKINKFWLLAGSLTLLWLSVFIVGNSISYFYLQHEQQQLQQQITVLYQQLFPESTNVVAPELRIQQEIQKIQQQQSDQGFLTLLEKTGNILKASSKLQLEHLSYQNNTLHLTIAVPDIQSWKILQNTIKDKGLKVGQVNIKPSSNNILVTFIVSDEAR
jgi:general secretion pathway protein L